MCGRSITSSASPNPAAAAASHAAAPCAGVEVELRDQRRAGRSAFATARKSCGNVPAAAAPAPSAQSHCRVETLIAPSSAQPAAAGARPRGRRVARRRAAPPPARACRARRRGRRRRDWRPRRSSGPSRSQGRRERAVRRSDPAVAPRAPASSPCVRSLAAVYCSASGGGIMRVGAGDHLGGGNFALGGRPLASPLVAAVVMLLTLLGARPRERRRRLHPRRKRAELAPAVARREASPPMPAGRELTPL